MNGLILKVNPEVLKQQSGKVQQHITDAENAFRILEQSVNKTASYWIGEAGDHHRKLYQQIRPQVEEAFKRLREHPGDMLEIAGIYESTEKNAVSRASTLRGNVIS